MVAVCDTREPPLEALQVELVAAGQDREAPDTGLEANRAFLGFPRGVSIFPGKGVTEFLHRILTVVANGT